MTSLYVIRGYCDEGGETMIAFTTREKAEAWIGPWADDYAIFEMELDPEPPRIVEEAEGRGSGEAS
jgi:hypothetical protein